MSMMAASYRDVGALSVRWGTDRSGRVSRRLQLGDACSAPGERHGDPDYFACAIAFIAPMFSFARSVRPAMASA
jgi:hypothetical protein